MGGIGKSVPEGGTRIIVFLAGRCIGKAGENRRPLRARAEAQAGSSQVVHGLSAGRTAAQGAGGLRRKTKFFPVQQTCAGSAKAQRAGEPQAFRGAKTCGSKPALRFT